MDEVIMVSQLMTLMRRAISFCLLLGCCSGIERAVASGDVKVAQQMWRKIEERGVVISSLPNSIASFPDLQTNTMCLGSVMSAYITVMLLGEAVPYDEVVATNALISGIVKGRLEAIRMAMGVDSDTFNKDITNPAIDAFKAKMMPEKQLIFADCAQRALNSIRK